MADSLMQDLRGRFREESRVRLEEMSVQLAALERDSADATALQKLARHFHALAGMGSTYGFPRVTALGDEAEGAILPLVKGGITPDAQVVAWWRDVVRQMEEELEEEAPAAMPVVRTFDVLVVEEEPELALRIAEGLRKEGLAARIVVNREQARAAMDERLPDAVVIGSAYEVLEDLRARPGGEAVGAIVISTGDFVEKIRALHSGADAFVGHPLDVAALVRRVSAFRTRRQHVTHRILAVEDDATTAVLIRGILTAARYEVEICRDPAEFEKTLLSFAPDLLLMDVQLSHDVTGHDLVRYVRQSDRFSAVPIIIVTSDSERRAVVDGVHAGADMLVTKPVDWDLLLSEIAARLERAVAMREQTERDPLTGVLTRSAFEARVRERLENHSAPPPVLVLLDLDHFKEINDTRGHAAGDAVLASVGTLLRRSLRQTDVAGRYGGEEFVLLLDGVDLGGATRLGERLLSELSATVTFSAGVAVIGDSYEEAFRRADAALYEAKRAGRARIIAA